MRVLGFVGVYTKRTFGFRTVYTNLVLKAFSLVNKPLVASITRNEMPPKTG